MEGEIKMAETKKFTMEHKNRVLIASLLEAETP